jgi:hypothetical protein
MLMDLPASKIYVWAVPDLPVAISLLTMSVIEDILSGIPIPTLVDQLVGSVLAPQIGPTLALLINVARQLLL